jgi:hypothetical protein
MSWNFVALVCAVPYSKRNLYSKPATYTIVTLSPEEATELTRRQNRKPRLLGELGCLYGHSAPGMSAAAMIAIIFSRDCILHPVSSSPLPRSGNRTLVMDRFRILSVSSFDPNSPGFRRRAFRHKSQNGCRMCKTRKVKVSASSASVRYIGLT